MASTEYDYSEIVYDDFILEDYLGRYKLTFNIYMNFK